MHKNSLKRHILYFLFLYIGNVVAISTSCIIFILPEGLKALGAGEGLIGFIIGIPRYFLIFCCLLLRKNADQANQSKLILYAAFTGVLVLLGITFSKNLMIIIVYSAFFGFTSAISMSYMTSLAIKYTPIKKRISVMGLFATSSSLGLFFCPFLGSKIGPLYNAIFPNFVAFSGVITSLAWGIFAFLALLISKKLKPVEAPLIFSNSEEINAGIRIYFPLIPFTIVFGTIYSVFSSFIQSYSHYLGLTEATTLLFTSFALISLFERLFLLRVFEKMKKKYVVYLGFLFYFTGLAYLILLMNFPSNQMVIFAGLFFGAGHGILYPTINVLFTNMTPNNLGNATLVFLISFVIGVIFSPLLGFFIDYFGYQVTFMIVFIVGFILTFWFLFNKKTQNVFARLDEIS